MQIFRAAMARGLRAHCLLRSAFDTWRSREHSSTPLAIGWREDTPHCNSEELFLIETSFNGEPGPEQVHSSTHLCCLKLLPNLPTNSSCAAHSVRLSEIGPQFLSLSPAEYMRRYLCIRMTAVM